MLLLPDCDFMLLNKVEINARLNAFILDPNTNYESFFQGINLPSGDREIEKVSLPFENISLDESMKSQLKRGIAPPMFKNHFDNDLSLTTIGFATVIAAKLYPFVYSDRIKRTEISIPNTLILLRDYFESPYFVEKNTVYYFDSVCHIEIKVFGGLESFVKIKRTQMR